MPKSCPCLKDQIICPSTKPCISLFLIIFFSLNSRNILVGFFLCPITSVFNVVCVNQNTYIYITIYVHIYQIYNHIYVIDIFMLDIYIYLIHTYIHSVSLFHYNLNIVHQRGTWVTDGLVG